MIEIIAKVAVATILTVLVLTLALAFRNARLLLQDARAREAELTRRVEAEGQLKNVLALLSAEIDRHTKTTDTVLAVLQIHDGDLTKTQAVHEQYLGRMEKLLAKAVEGEVSHIRVLTIMQDQINWLRKTRRDAESYERATQNLEAERLVRQSGSADEAISAGPAAYEGPLDTGPKVPMRHAAVKKIDVPDDPMADLNDVAAAVLKGNGMKGSAPPVPGTGE